MIVQLARRDQVDTIMEGTKTGGDFDRDQTRVSRQVPTEARHATAKLYHIGKLIKENHPHAAVTVKDRHVYVNNNKIKPAVIPPTMEQTLSNDPNEIDILNNINFYLSDLVGMKGSTFRAIVSPASNAEDARYAYIAVSRFPGVAAASHLISAYITLNDEFDYEDDGDHGLGRHVFEIIQKKGIDGVIVFLSRDFGGIHLGKDRFSIINRVVGQALGRYNAALQRNPNIQHPDRLHVHSSAPPSNKQPHIGKDIQAASSEEANGSDNTNNEARAPMGSPKAACPIEASSTIKDNEGKDQLSKDIQNMDVQEQEGDNTDMTIHKSSYNGTPIKHSEIDSRGLAAESDKQEISYPPPLPFSQFAGSLNASPSQTPTILQHVDHEGVTLPNVRRGNVFKQMMVAKQTRMKNKKKTNKKSGNKGHPITLDKPNLLDKPFPGISKIKSPIGNALNASTLSTADTSSPKRDRATMEGQNENGTG
jgi:hypothetical protein